MTTMIGDNAIQTDPVELQDRWSRLRAEVPGLRIRDAADRLGVPEARLLATTCGDGTTRLTGDWGSLLKALEPLGPLMALTRNAAAVHEKTGVYRGLQVFEGGVAQITEPEIDLRLFLGRWRHAFAITQAGPNGAVRSFQFFDAYGAAVHKVFLRAQGPAPLWEALADAHGSPDQSPALTLATPPLPPAALDDRDADVAALVARWEALEDTHGFHRLLTDLGLGRTQALRLAGSDRARRVSIAAGAQALEAAREAELDLLVFVGNPGAIQIHTGPVRQLKRVDAWFNVMDPGFSLHLHEPSVAEAWVVRKPTQRGDVWSLELYDAGGTVVLQLFASRKAGAAGGGTPAWQALLAGIA